MKKPFLFFWFPFLSLTKVFAQPLLPMDKEDRLTSLIFCSVSIEPQLTLSIGYQAPIKLAHGQLRIGPRVQLLPLAFRNSAYKLSFLTSYYEVLFGGARIILHPELYLSHLNDRSAEMSSIGFQLGATPYWISRNWTKGLSISWQHAVATKIRYSSATHETFNERYPDDSVSYPADGWYASTVDRFRLGVQTGRQIGDHSMLQLRLGTQVIRQKQKILLAFPYAQLPVYAEAVFSRNF